MKCSILIMMNLSLCRSWRRCVHLISGLSSLASSLRARLRSWELRVRRHYMENIWKPSMPLSICWWTEIELQVWAHYSDKRCAGVTSVSAGDAARCQLPVRNAGNASCETLTILEDENKERLLSVCLSLTMNIKNIFGVLFLGDWIFQSKRTKTHQLVVSSEDQRNQLVKWNQSRTCEGHISPQYQKDLDKEFNYV